MFTFASRVLRWVMVTAIVTVPASGSARALYVSPDGDDKASGTIERPWRTLRASLGRLEPGDTLNLYGGRYFEDGLILDARGTTEQPIVIRSASGDRCWIGAEGGVFIKAKSGTWQSVDEAKKIYRLKNPPPSKVTSKLTGGWLWVREKIQLVPYTDQKLFASSNSGVKGYIGPGFFLDKRELRVRLEMPKVPSDSPSVAGGVPSIESDPDLHNFFFCSGKGPTLTVRKAAHIVLENLDFEPSGRRTIEITGDSHHVTINDCSVLVRTLGIVAQEGTHDLAIRNCTFQMGFPPWVAWGDVKGGSRGAGFNPAEEAGWNSFAIVGAWKSSVIEHCTFLDCFDGIFLRAGSENVVVSNNSILRSRDDAIDLAPNVSKIEISHNLIWRCFEGISLVGEKGGKNAAGKKAKGESAGEVFIHHNVIDVSARHFAERKEDAAYFSSEWSAGIAFGRHDCGSDCETALWRLYNNTIVARGKTKIVPVSMPLAILSNNLFADPDDPECALEPNPIERSDSATRTLYDPLKPMTPSEDPPPGSSAWPEFDARTVGAIR